MWDWVKKAAGYALDKGVEYLRHFNAIQQVLNAPSYEHASLMLRQYVTGLESEANFRFFMSVVTQQTQQAYVELQNAQASPSGSSWGSSSEDRIAQMMAEIQSGYHAGNSPHVPAAQKKLHDLNLLAQYAQQLWHEAQNPSVAPPPPTIEAPRRLAGGRIAPSERVLAVQRHAREILSFGEPHEDNREDIAASGGPLTEIEAMQLVLKADRRMMKGMINCMPGMAAQEGVEEMESLHRLYARILRDRPSDSTLVKARDLRKKMGQALDLAAKTCATLRDDAEALAYCRRAAEEFQHAGDAAEVTRLERKACDLEIELEGRQGARVLELQGRLDEVEDPSIEKVELLVALGAACTKDGDSFAARDHLRAAEAMLEALGIPEPSGRGLARDLMSSVSQIQSGTARGGRSGIEQSMAALANYKQLYQAFAAAYRDTDPAEADYDADMEQADEYLRKWERLDSDDENKTFSDEALKLLHGEFAGLLRS